MNDTPDPEDSENRAARRQRTLLTGKLVYGPVSMTQDCAISDMSKTGARVRLEGAEPLVDPIYLIDVRHGLAFEAKVAWRRGRMAGLSFHQYFDLQRGDPEAPASVRRIWVEQTRQEFR